MKMKKKRMMYTNILLIEKKMMKSKLKIKDFLEEKIKSLACLNLNQ